MNMLMRRGSGLLARRFSANTKRTTTAASVHENISKISDIVAVTSCKGGVGKSTVAVNLACSLSRKGHKVALLDADLYGPSLPTMVDVNDRTVRTTSCGKYIEPLSYDAGGISPLKVMSYGFVNAKAGPGAGGGEAAIMR
jgi:Mrp family chromosome partitioning ATPase